MAALGVTRRGEAGLGTDLGTSPMTSFLDAVAAFDSRLLLLRAHRDGVATRRTELKADRVGLHLGEPHALEARFDRELLKSALSATVAGRCCSMVGQRRRR